MNSRGSILSIVLKYCVRFQPYWLPSLLVFTVLTALGGVTALLQKPVYEAEGKIVLKRVTPASTLTGVGQEVGRLDPLTNLGNPALTELEIIQSTPVIEAALKKLDLHDPSGKEISVSDFQRKLAVSAVNSADIIKITFKDGEAEKASEAVNQVIKAYMASKVQSNQDDIVRTRQFIEKQLPKAEADVKQIETEFRQFKSANQLVDLGDKVTSTAGRMNELQRQISDNQAQLANTNAQMAATAQKIGMSPSSAIALAALSQSPEIQDTVKEIQSTETELVRTRERFTDDHPTVAQLKNNIADLKNLLKQKSAKILGSSLKGEEVPDPNILVGALKQDLSADLVRLDSTRQGLEKQISDLSQTLENVRKQSIQLPRLVQKQADLERKVQAAQTGYNTLLEKLKETQISENQTQGNAKVVAWASPPDKPAGLSRSIVVLLGIILGLFGGTATAYLLDATHPKIRSIEDAQNLFGLKLIGVIPVSERSRNRLFYDDGKAYHIPEVAVRDKPGSPTCEAYRLLQSNLKTNGNRRSRVLIVTSSIPHEGSSTVCANLAAAIAQTGRRVLLVDANLHSPVQDEIWYIPYMEGLSNILAEEVSFWTAVHNVAPNLDVLPAGNSPALPSLLDSAQMELVIDHCSSIYDMVILDTPALTASADATLMTNLVDGGLLVVRPNRLDLDNAIAAQGILDQWGDKMLGMVINGAPLSQFVYSYETPDPQEGLKSVGTAIPIPPNAIAAEAQADLPWLPLNAAPESAPSGQPLDHLKQADLEKLSAAELKALSEALSQDWLRSTRLIQEQEAELDLQTQTVSELQERLSAAGAYHRHAANEYDRLSLEVQLADGEERKRLLDQTLIGQRRRLREQHDLLKKSLQLMREKPMPSNGSNGSVLDQSAKRGYSEI